jgi:hypothetical protein
MLREYEPLADLRDRLRQEMHVFSTHFFSKLTEVVVLGQWVVGARLYEAAFRLDVGLFGRVRGRALRR